MVSAALTCTLFVLAGVWPPASPAFHTYTWGVLKVSKLLPLHRYIPALFCLLRPHNSLTNYSASDPTPYPCCVGHEIIGKVVKTGSKVENSIKVGDRVGVGAQSAACLKPECEECAAGMENHCQIAMVPTFGQEYPDGKGMAYGGYADHWRGSSHFVFKIPEALSSEVAAPMMCGGVTVYSPLKHNGCGPGRKVGIVGIGGLGHFGLLFAKALGASEITAISRNSHKKEDAKMMGATNFIATDEDEDWVKHNMNNLDLVVCTVSSPKMPIEGYLSLLRVQGTFIQVGAPEDNIPPFNAFSLIAKGVKMGGSAIGSPDTIREMLQLAAEKGIKSWTNPMPMKECNKAIQDF